MGNTNTTPNMKLIVPTLQDPGPAYAQSISNDLVVIDGHDHDGVNGGVQINIAGQLIEDDLSLDGYNLSNVRSIQFQNNPSILTGSQDINSIYVEQNTLGFNDNNGVFVPIVQDGYLVINNAVYFTNFSIRSVSSNFTILPTDTYNTININSTGGAVTGTLPIAATITPNAAGRVFLFNDEGGDAATHNITIQVAVASGNTFNNGATSFVINSNGGYFAIFTDGVSVWNLWTQNVYNSEVLTLNDSGLDLIGGTIGLNNTSAMTVSANSSITSQGTTHLTGSSVTIIDDTSVVALENSVAVTWSNTANETFHTGTSVTHQAGSTITMAGSETMSGTLTLSGTVTGTSTFTGTLNGSSSPTISFDYTGSISNRGNTTVFGLYNEVNYMTAAGTYNCDNGTIIDNTVGIELTTGGANWNVDLPSSPANGRVITICDVLGPNVGTSSYNVYINSGTPKIAIPGYYNGSSYVPPSLATQIIIEADATNSAGVSANVGSWAAFANDFWSVTFTYMVGGPSPGRWVMTANSFSLPQLQA